MIELCRGFLDALFGYVLRIDLRTRKSFVVTSPGTRSTVHHPHPCTCRVMAEGCRAHIYRNISVPIYIHADVVIGSTHGGHDLVIIAEHTKDNSYNFLDYY